MDWQILLSTFGLVFVAELGDKTQLAVVTQTCKYRRPWAVFLGASTALTAVTVLSVVAGQLLGQVVPTHLLRTVAALAFVVMGLLIGREGLKARAGSGDRELVCDLATGADRVDMDCTLVSGWDWKAFGATLGLVGKNGAPVSVFLGGALALTAVTALGIVGGQGLCRLVPERVLLSISALAFLVMGVLMGIGVL